MYKAFIFVFCFTYCPLSISFENCFYLQTVTYASNYGYTTLPAGYTLQTVWDTQQIGITKYSYFLSGFQIHHLPNPILTYDASLNNVSSTSGTFTFNPYNNSAIYYISFSLILLKTTTGMVELQYIQYYTISFNDSSHLADFEILNIYVSTTFKISVSNYKSDVMLSSFQIASALDFININIGIYNININDTFQQFQLNSAAIYSNHIFKICLTYVMFEIYSFNYTIIFYSARQNVNTNYHLLSVPSQFYPNPSRKCIFGINILKTNFVTLNESTVIYLQGSNSVNFINSNTNGYSKICIQSCPRNSFANYSISEVNCYSCEQNLINCYSCSSLIVCDQCNNDYFLEPLSMKCYRICPDGQYGNTTTLTCVSCSNSSIYMMVNGTCGCRAGYRMLNSICTNITGCLTLVYESYVPVCKFCSLTEGFDIVNDSCQCATGFSSLNTSCMEICGDGLLFHLACDDGNRQNGDGCSSACQLQQNYACTIGSSSNASLCVYLKHDISLSLKKIEKVDLMNQGIFYFQLSPVIYSMNKLNLTRDVSFSCIPNITISSMSLTNGQLIIYANFSEDIEGRQANVTLRLQNSYFLQSYTKTNFTMISNGMKLIITKDHTKMLMCKESIEIISLVIIILFVLSSLTHKMIGVEMIHSYQVIYLVHLLNGDYTQLYSLLRFFSYSAFDFLMIKDNLSTIVSVHTQISFGQANLELSITLIVGISVISLFIFTIVHLLWGTIQQSKEKLETNHPKQFFNFSLVPTYSYNHLLFPFAISTLLVTFVILDSKNRQSLPIRFSYSCVFQMLLLSGIFFYEFKGIFIQHNCKQTLLGVRNCKRQYHSHYLLLTFVVAIVLCLSFQNQRIPVEFILVGLYVFFLTYLIINLPYSSNFHNIGVITNTLLLIYFLTWSGLKSYNLISQSEDSQLLTFFIFILLSIISLFTTFLRIMHQISKGIAIIRQNLHQRNKKEQKTLNKRQQLEDVEIKQEEFLKKITKDNLKDSREIDPSLFIHAKDKKRDNAKELLKKNMRAKLRKRYSEMNNRDSLL